MEIIKKAGVHPGHTLFDSSCGMYQRKITEALASQKQNRHF